MYVTVAFASASVVVTVVKSITPSSKVKLASEVKTGALSLESVIETTIVWLVTLTPSLAVTVTS